MRGTAQAPRALPVALLLSALSLLGEGVSRGQCVGRTRVGAHKHPWGSRSPSSQDHQAPAKKYKQRKKSKGAQQNNAASSFASPSPTRVLAGAQASVQLCPDKRRTGTAFIALPWLLTGEQLLAKMPAAMPSYPPDADWDFHTVNLWLQRYWDKMPVSLSRGNLDFLSLLWAR